MAAAGVQRGRPCGGGGRQPAAPVRLACWPRSRWARAGAAVPGRGATEFVFPINNAEVGFAIVEDQEQVDKMLEMREQCPQLARIWFDDPRGLRNYDEPGLAAWTH
jgi:hypothetical protein